LVGAGPPSGLLVVLAVGLGLATGGCGDPAFTPYAVAEAGKSLIQARVAVGECRRDLAVDRDRQAELQWKAYVAVSRGRLVNAAMRDRPALISPAGAPFSAQGDGRTRVQGNRKRIVPGRIGASCYWRLGCTRWPRAWASVFSYAPKKSEFASSQTMIRRRSSGGSLTS